MSLPTTHLWRVGNSLPSHSKHLTAALGEEELEIEPSRSPETQVETAKPHLSMMEMKCRYPLLLGFVACAKAPGNALWAPWTASAGSHCRFSGALALRLPLVAFNCVSQNALWLESGRKSHVQSLNPWPLPCCVSHLSRAKQKKLCCLKENSSCEAENLPPSPLTQGGVLLVQRDIHFARLPHLNLCRNGASFGKSISACSKKDSGTFGCFSQSSLRSLLNSPPNWKRKVNQCFQGTQRISGYVKNLHTCCFLLTLQV